jgi:hypothetical protein
MNKLKTLLVSLIIGLAIGIVVFACTNPPGNPPTGGGTIGVGTNAPANSIYVKSDGNVGIGTAGPGTKLVVGGFAYTGGDYPGVNAVNTVNINNPNVTTSADQGYQLTLTETGALGANKGGALGFQAVYDASSNVATIAGIKGLRENATADNLSGYLSFLTRGATGVPTERVRINSSGNVGIGTTNPGARLDVGGGNITGVNKISVNTIDPVFKINGQKYVTFVPDSIGQKVEVVGAAQLVNGEWSMDLAKQSANSDLWLFYQIVKPESIIPFVSSQSSASLYAFLDGSKLVVKLKDGDSQARFSYRLIADRIDSQGNDYLLPETEKNEVYIDVDSLKNRSK